ncbi:MAG: preprotein translocase subunit SecG [Candidatus Marinamargulisbacteria bacterium]|jgi:preprotein translocase subunit SecG
MKTFLLIVEFMTSAALIVAILLHSAKGEGLGGIGGQARVFGTQKGLESGLDKITATLAITFMLVACILGLYF